MHPDLNSFKLSLHRGCRSRFLETIFNGPMRDNCVQTLLRHFSRIMFETWTLFFYARISLVSKYVLLAT